MSQDTITYLINGRKYTFEGVRIKDGYRYGYCKKRKKWAYLFDRYLQFEGEEPVVAEMVK